MRVVDHFEDSKSRDAVCYSFEYFPPKTRIQCENLRMRLREMCSDLRPSFVSITWGAGGSTAERSMDLASFIQQELKKDTVLHLTCARLSENELEQMLKVANEHGIHNVLALRGDPPDAAETFHAPPGGFSHAVQLVKLLRSNYANKFGVLVAGYPAGHPESESPESDIAYLKEKVDAGADAIVTQFFYDIHEFLGFAKRCRDAGITVPIIPGIMPVDSYRSFHVRVKFCHTYVPPEVLAKIEEVKTDDAEVRAFGLRYVTEMCRMLVNAGFPHLHFYTMNLVASIRNLVKNLNFLREGPQPSLPFAPSVSSKGEVESVRPIFWSARTQSYLSRICVWDEFPNGRWGHVSNPAFGNIVMAFNPAYHRCSEEHVQSWGDKMESFDEMQSLFLRFYCGKVNSLPWCEQNLASESSLVIDFLRWLVRRNVFPINSQPCVNAAPSVDPVVGWGPKLGYVYQKQYIECFFPKSKLDELSSVFKDYPYIMYFTISANDEWFSNVPEKEEGPVAVTWGVFPGKEVVQPTVVDPVAFRLWKDEAYGLLRTWTSRFPEGSTSREFLTSFADDYVLLSVVDNDYVKGDLFPIFEKILR